MAMETIDVLLLEGDLQDAVLVQLWLARARQVRFRLRHVTRLAQLAPALEDFNPQVVLLDFFLPDEWGYVALDRVMHAVGDTPVVVLTPFEDASVGRRLLAAGAAGRLGKGVDSLRRLEDTLLDALATHRIGHMLASA
jgi:DNA-binding NarL/FixJ family response regulator